MPTLSYADKAKALNAKGSATDVSAAAPSGTDTSYKVVSHKKNKGTVGPRVVILHVPTAAATSEHILRLSKSGGVNLRNVSLIEIKKNMKPNSFRAVLHMASDGQANELLQQTEKAHLKLHWTLRKYQDWGLRGAISLPFIVDPSVHFTNAAKAELDKTRWGQRNIKQYDGLCFIADDEDKCTRYKCHFTHRAGPHVRGPAAGPPTAAPTADRGGAAGSE